MTDTVDLRPFGYAPGGYVFTCRDCGVQDFLTRPLGDKRSTRCEAHALAAKAIADAAPPKPARIPETTILWREWKDGSITAAQCPTLTQLAKQIERDQKKAVRMWRQEVTFDPANCIELGS